MRNNGFLGILDIRILRRERKRAMVRIARVSALMPWRPSSDLHTRFNFQEIGTTPKKPRQHINHRIGAWKAGRASRLRRPIRKWPHIHKIKKHDISFLCSNCNLASSLSIRSRTTTQSTQKRTGLRCGFPFPKWRVGRVGKPTVQKRTWVGGGTSLSLCNLLHSSLGALKRHPQQILSSQKGILGIQLSSE